MSNPGQESTDNKAIRELRDNLSDLNKSTKWNNGIMIFLTIVLVILTTILVIPTIIDWLKIVDWIRIIFFK